MAYNYFPATYQPNYYGGMYNPQPNIPQVPTPAQQPQQQPQNQSSILWVNNNQEAAMYPVAPNNAVVLWDRGVPVIYLKQADATGKPSMKTYDLVERVEKPLNTSQAQEGSNTTYATKSELAALAGAVKDVDGILASIREDVDTLKGKMTSKRSVKKDREQEDERND